MKQWKYRNAVRAMGLLILFVAYQAGIMAFAHIHCIDGAQIVHSHPAKAGHTHTKGELLVIGQLTHFQSVEAPSYELEHPLRPLLRIIEAVPASPAAKGTPVRHAFLRAPPAFVFA